MKIKNVFFGVLILLIAIFPAVSQDCSPVDATISPDFSYYGSGSFCWESTCLGDYINSWNLDSLRINGQDFTNVYVSSYDYPSPINGTYYIEYKGSFSWSYIELRGFCGPIPTNASETPTPTVVPTDPVVTPIPSVGEVNMSPSQVRAEVGEDVSFSLIVNSGNKHVAAYGIEITYNYDVLGNAAVEEGADGFVSSVNTKGLGIIRTTGFDATGTGPGSNLELLIVSFTAIAPGMSSIAIKVLKLVDEHTGIIGLPYGIGGRVEIEGTVTAGPADPPVVTEPPSTDVCTCYNDCNSSVSISPEFTHDGKGEFCWVTQCLGDYINCWNLNILEINGVDVTNTFIMSHNYPPAIDGLYYIYYNGDYSWSHFEVTGTCNEPLPTDAPIIPPTVTAPPANPPFGTDSPVGEILWIETFNNESGGRFLINQEKRTWSSESIHISGSSITISAEIEGDDPEVMESSDYLNLYYSIDGGSQKVWSQNKDGFSLKTVTVSGLKGNTLVVSLQGYTSYLDETYYIDNIVVSDGVTLPTNPPIITYEPTQEPTDALSPGIGDVAMSPSHVSAEVGAPVLFAIIVNSGDQRVAAYGINITYDEKILGNAEVDDGADGFVSSVNTIEPGIIITSGFDATGTDPGTNLELLIVSFTARAAGTSAIGITVNKLVDETTEIIGVPHGRGGFVVLDHEQGTPEPTVEPTVKPTVEPTPIPADLIINMVCNDSSHAAGWSVKTNIQEDDDLFGDRTYTINTLPSFYRGSNWIRTACSSKNYTGNILVTFTITRDAYVYVVFDDRADFPDWLSSWSDTSDNLIDSESVTFSIYSKAYTANSQVSLGENGDSKGCCGYSIIVKDSR